MYLYIYVCSQIYNMQHWGAKYKSALRQKQNEHLVIMVKVDEKIVEPWSGGFPAAR